MTDWDKMKQAVAKAGFADAKDFRREPTSPVDVAKILAVAARNELEGFYVTAQAEGAFPNGCRVIKKEKKEGDGHDVGARATVIGSMKAPEGGRSKVTYFYFVVWDDMPSVAVGIADYRIGLEQ